MFVFGTIIVTTLIEKLYSFRETDEPMCESSRDIDLILLVCGEADAGPFAEVWRPLTNIHSNIQSFAFDDTANLRLWMIQLVVETAESILLRSGMIVLDEVVREAQLGELGAMVRLEEKSAGIAMDKRA